MSFSLRIALVALLIGTAAGSAGAAGGDLTELSIEELLSVEVTSVAKKRQRVEDAAAAVFVISQADIRRSGATRITDLLRMVPGVQVGEIDSNAVAVSARGFNERLSNKLLVLVDGRAIYRSVVSGVLWDQVLVPLEEIERIEVVRGPGATLWGANAVNGVINIITKHPIDSQGGLVSAGIATDDFANLYSRWGGLLGEDGAWRFYVRSETGHGLVDAQGDWLASQRHASQAGFRVDWEPTAQDAFTFQGDVHFGDYESVVDQSGTSGFGFLPLSNTGESFSGFNALARWARSRTEYGDFSVQGYVDHLERGEFGSDLSSTIVGIDFQHSLPRLGRHEIVWGLNYLLTRDEAQGMFINLGSGTETNQLAGLFLQDEIALLPAELSLTLGTKLEYNSFTGFEIQPSARLFWRLDPDFALWGAVSHEVRTPARFEDDLDVRSDPIPPFTPPNSAPLPLTIAVLGNPDLDAETLDAFELGARFKPAPGLALDIAGYVNLYDNLILLDTLAPSVGPGGITSASMFGNGGAATGYGVEIAADWAVTERWALKGAYSLQQIDYRGVGDDDLRAGRFDGLTPRHQVSLRSQFDLTPDIEFDLWLRAQTDLSESDTPGFVDLDARLSWRPQPGLELSIVGRNLLHDHRRDFYQRQYLVPAGEVQRSVLAQIEFRF